MDEGAHLGRGWSSPWAKCTLAALRISLARRGSRTSQRTAVYIQVGGPAGHGTRRKLVALLGYSYLEDMLTNPDEHVDPTAPAPRRLLERLLLW